MRELGGADLHLVYLFVHLVNAGSFSQVAKELSMPIATVSRQLAKLEMILDQQLLMRSTRKFRLTEKGLALFERYQGVINQFDELNDDGLDRPEGTLRIAAPISIISMVLLNALNDFCDTYPDIRLHIAQSNQEVDLIDKAVDIAIVGGAQPDSSWIATSLGVLDYCLMAAPEYLAAAAPLIAPTQLSQHKLIKVWPLFNWSLTHRQGEHFYYDGPARLTLMDLHGAIKAAVASGGVLYGPALFAKEELASGQLVKVLPDWRGEQRRISMLYHQRSQQPLKVQLFLAFMQARAPQLFAMAS
ncbi:LysR family transcriptional regulator [Shewanella sp. NIFS-20-20]|uniref:LysR family transcriptional regulator n=1 Tax=Shewanella sp. NIFS-20-20 TaxID=2853806 RepID=UPI001C44C17D|nr:LysR family transcriptional regulator [Shewanella sp. NIFS-20-20]MBV7316735.1 LysR family transcriptional regulator [Shewanella sp. NIFS-20-20]